MLNQMRDVSNKRIEKSYDLYDLFWVWFLKLK